MKVKNKRGSEMLATIVIIAILGTLIISVVTMFSETIKSNNEFLIEEVERPPMLINK